MAFHFSGICGICEPKPSSPRSTPTSSNSYTRMHTEYIITQEYYDTMASLLSGICMAFAHSGHREIYIHSHTHICNKSIKIMAQLCSMSHHGFAFLRDLRGLHTQIIILPQVHIHIAKLVRSILVFDLLLLSGVTVVLQRCYTGVTVVLPNRYIGITVVLQ
jgi:hypothetical protein